MEPNLVGIFKFVEQPCFPATTPHWVNALTHWGRVTHICIVKLTIIGSDNGLSPGRRQAIIWTNAGILLIRPLGTNFSEILIGIQTWKCHLPNAVHLFWPQCVKHQSSVLGWQQLGRTDSLSIFFYAKLWREKINVGPTRLYSFMQDRLFCNFTALTLSDFISIGLFFIIFTEYILHI